LYFQQVKIDCELQRFTAKLGCKLPNNHADRPKTKRTNPTLSPHPSVVTNVNPSSKPLNQKDKVLEIFEQTCKHQILLIAGYVLMPEHIDLLTAELPATP
jgi:hypothetical protein